METQALKTGELPIQFGEGLVLRRSNAEDADALSDFNAKLHSELGPEKPDERVRAWTHDLLAKPHPSFSPSDFTIVEELDTGKIVSSMNLIPQTWTYAGIPFKVGRPELVGTLPEYRHRGLIRKQFDVVHRWSAEYGHKVQAITGIPYYYRQFGYEMAMNLSGGHTGYTFHIPRIKEGEQEPYRIRPATEEDIPLLCHLSALGNARSLVACAWDENTWRYELSGKSDNNVNREEIRIIETQEGKSVGIFAHPPFAWGETMALLWYEILPECSWLEVTPIVIRYLERVHAQMPPPHSGERKPFGAFGFVLGEDHPVYHAIPGSLPYIRKPYAWYLRLVDVPDFLRLITPVLETRLSNSALAGYSGELKLTFYRDGVRIVLVKGQLATVEGYKPHPYGHQGDVGFPPHTFLQLLFGYRNMDMLKSSFPDVWTEKNEYHVLLDALFPRQITDLWPVS